MDRDDLRPCAGCGRPCDGDVCDSRCEQEANYRTAVGFLHEREFDTEGEESGPAQASVAQDYYCLDCEEEGETVGVSTVLVSRNDLRRAVAAHPFGHAPECCVCGSSLSARR